MKDKDTGFQNNFFLKISCQCSSWSVTDNPISKQESIPVECVLPAFVVRGGVGYLWSHVPSGENPLSFRLKMQFNQYDNKLHIASNLLILGFSYIHEHIIC